MTGAAQTDVTALERRYRRLLTWYPAGHRRLYGEEMIGVLLASAPTGQNRPGNADILDLIGGGLRARLRWSRTGEGNPAWRDALAVFSVVAPVVLLGWLTAGYLAYIEEQMASPLLRYYQPISRTDSALLTVLIATGVAVAALAVIPLLARRGQATAAAMVGVIAAAAAAIGLVQVYRVFGAPDTEFTLYLSLIAVMEVLALVASPGPARGWQLLSRRGVVGLTVISVVVIAACTASGARNEYWNYVNTILDISGGVSVLGVALTLRWPVGSRLMALWAIPGYQFFGFAAAQYLFTSLQFGSYVAFEVEFRFLPTVVIAVLVGLAAWRSGRQSRRHTTDASN
jgi:hypothetical protein